MFGEFSECCGWVGQMRESNQDSQVDADKDSRTFSMASRTFVLFSCSELCDI